MRQLRMLACLSLMSATLVANADFMAIGVTEPISHVTLSMPVSGIVEDLRIREGSRVDRNDVLLKLDRDIEALEMQSKLLILEDQSAIVELQQRILILEDQVRRGRDLLIRGGVSEKQIEDEELVLIGAKAELKARLQAKRRETIDHALAETYFTRRQLLSPVDGIVTQINIAVGETVKPQEPLITLVDVSRIKFRGTFSVTEPARFRVGEMAQVVVKQHGEAVQKPARVTYVSPIADPSSGLIEIIAEIDNSDALMIPGTTAELRY